MCLLAGGMIYGKAACGASVKTRTQAGEDRLLRARDERIDVECIAVILEWPLQLLAEGESSPEKEEIEKGRDRCPRL